MLQEITRSEYERSIDRVRGRRDRTYQIARISGITFAIFAIAPIFTQSRGGEIHALPRFTFIAGIAILAVFGIVLPLYAYVRRESPRILSVLSLRLARRGVITDDLLCELMVCCTLGNRETVEMFDKSVERKIIPGMLVGISAVLVAVVGLCL